MNNKPKILYSTVGLLFFTAVGIGSLYLAYNNFAVETYPYRYHIAGWALLVIAVLAWGELVQTLFHLDGCAGIVLTYLALFLVLSQLLGAVDWIDILTNY